jgi:uncharacterized protein YjbI with pentapeptide repeats
VARARSKKVLPDPPEVPAEWDPAPATVDTGETWDGVDAGADVEVPSHLADFTMQECRWVDADLSGRRLSGFRGRDVQFVNCDLSGAVLEDAVLARVRFEDCRMTGVVFGGADLTDVHIVDSRADLSSFRMAKAKFLRIENTSLRAADFYEFAVSGCGLIGCDLAEATFDDARLSEIDLHGSTLDDVRGALALRGSRISSDQLVPLGAALLAALDIQVTEQTPSPGAASTAAPSARRRKTAPS